MPWKVGDVEGFNKGLTDAEKERWVGAANGYLKTCLADGGSAETCEASAIKIANAAVKESRHESNGLGEKILEAIFDEHATVKATVQGFLRAAHAVARHPNVPAKIKKQVEDLRADLAAHKWADFNAEGQEEGTASASEATREALQSIRAATKTEDGKAFPASDFAYVPDPDKPSEWKLRLTATPGGAPDSGIVGAAIAALGPGGFRGNRVEIPAADLAGVKTKVRAAWKKANPDKEATDMPPVIREAFTEEGAIVEAAIFTEDGAIVEEGDQNG